MRLAVGTKVTIVRCSEGKVKLSFIKTCLLEGLVFPDHQIPNDSNQPCRMVVSNDNTRQFFKQQCVGVMHKSDLGTIKFEMSVQPDDK